MAEALLMEFQADELDAKALYEKVMTELDLGDTNPEGALSHVAGLAPTGEFVVFEVWESQAHQERFMTEQLLPAFERTGAPIPTRITWLEVLGTRTA